MAVIEMSCEPRGEFSFFFKQKTACEILAWLEFRRVLFRSRAVGEVEEAHEALGGEEDVEAVLAGAGDAEIVAGDALEALRPGLGAHLELRRRRAPEGEVDVAEILHHGGRIARIDEAAGAEELRYARVVGGGEHEVVGDARDGDADVPVRIALHAAALAAG